MRLIYGTVDHGTAEPVEPTEPVEPREMPVLITTTRLNYYLFEKSLAAIITEFLVSG